MFARYNSNEKMVHDYVMTGFHHAVAVLPLPFRRSAVVKFRWSVKIT